MSLISLGPRQNDGQAALRVGLSVTLPLLVLLLIGRPELAIYAVFGAFTGMYGRNEPHQVRLRHQALAAAMLVTGVGVGVLLSATGVSGWLLVAVESGFAGTVSLYADRLGLRPVGPFFALFALGACASVPLAVPALAAVGVAAAAAGCSLAIGFAGWLRSRSWEAGLQRQRIPVAEPLLRNAIAYTVAVLVAGGLSTALGLGHPIWAMAAAAVPLAASGTSHRMIRGTQRIVGTLLGLLVAGAILLPFGRPSALVLIVLVMILQFPSELFMTRNYALALVFFTPLILIMTALAHPVDPVALVTDRAVQTVLGALVGMAVVGVIGRTDDGLRRRLAAG